MRHADGHARKVVMNSTRILDWLGSAALTIAVLSLLFLFLPGVVRAENQTEFTVNKYSE